ncbi:MAG: hypothetical protein PHP82_02945 [Candidatus ainarchaeum sp.]|nr:hypothetical protein [Candidatus ainarchaeum sp.]
MKTKNKLKKDNFGQGAIEYLLIIGAAILVVSIVVIAIVGVTSTGTEGADEEAVTSATLILKCQNDCLIKNGNWKNNKCIDLPIGIELLNECETFEE